MVSLCPSLLPSAQEQLAEHLSEDCGLDEGWLQVCRSTEGCQSLVPVDTPDHLQRQQQLFGVDYRPVLRWAVGPLREAEGDARTWRRR